MKDARALQMEEGPLPLHGALWGAAVGSSLGQSPFISLSPSLSSRQGMRTENLRRARNNKQMAVECFMDGGRMLNKSNVAGKVQHKR